MTDGEATPKRRGRPPAPPEQRRRHNLTLRIRTDLRDKIQEMAGENGRSLSEEVEFLLETSMDPKSAVAVLVDQLAASEIEKTFEAAKEYAENIVKSANEMARETSLGIAQKAADRAKKAVIDAKLSASKLVADACRVDKYLSIAKYEANSEDNLRTIYDLNSDEFLNFINNLLSEYGRFRERSNKDLDETSI